MKFTTLAAILLPAVAMAGPVKRQDNNAITDELIFEITLPAFITRANSRDPPSLDWSTDSCSNSPNNPMGFPFDPACKRHDFGYRNYKAQSRFSAPNKLKIDSKFRDDLYTQCEGNTAVNACRALANVYYQAVRVFGRAGPAIVAKELNDYDLAVIIYEEEVKKAQDAGLLPILD